MSAFLTYLRALNPPDLATLGLTREHLEGSVGLEGRTQLTRRLAADLQAKGRWNAHAAEVNHAISAARSAVESALMKVGNDVEDTKHRDHIYEAAADLAMILVSGESLGRSAFDQLWAPYAEALPALKLFGPGWPLPITSIDKLETLLSTKGAVEILITHAPVPSRQLGGACVRCRSRMGAWQSGRTAKVSICEGCGLIAWHGYGEGSVRFFEVWRRGTLMVRS